MKGSLNLFNLVIKLCILHLWYIFNEWNWQNWTQDLNVLITIQGQITRDDVIASVVWRCRPMFKSILELLFFNNLFSISFLVMDWFRLFCHFPKLFFSLILQMKWKLYALFATYGICLTFSDCFLLLLEKSLKGLKFDWLQGAGTLIYSFYELKKPYSGMQVFRYSWYMYVHFYIGNRHCIKCCIFM